MSRARITLRVGDAAFTPQDARRWPRRKMRLYTSTTEWPDELIVTRVIDAHTVRVRELRTDLRGWY